MFIKMMTMMLDADHDANVDEPPEKKMKMTMIRSGR